MKTNNQREYSHLFEILPEVVKDIQDLSEGKRKLKAPDIKNRHELEKILRQNGIRRGSKSWQDYSKAKHLITGGEFIDSKLYDELVHYAVEYIGV